jgi:hypothetical protein
MLLYAKTEYSRLGGRFIPSPVLSCRGMSSLPCWVRVLALLSPCMGGSRVEGSESGEGWMLARGRGGCLCSGGMGLVLK